MYRRAWQICSADSKHKEGDYVSAARWLPRGAAHTFDCFYKPSDSSICVRARESARGKTLVRFSQLNHAYMVATRLLAFKSAFQACFQLLGSPSQAEVIVVHGLRGLGASLHEHALVFYAAVCM